jgi:hypothetical protein
MSAPQVSDNGASHSLLRLFSGDGRRLVAVIEVFMDEGGTHAGSRILCVAACAGTHAHWEHFLSRWHEKSFHAKDATDEMKLKLADAFDDSELEAIVTWVKPGDFRQHANQTLKNNLGNAFALCAFACALGMGRLAREFHVGPISFVLEAGQPNASYVERILKTIMQDPSSGIASVAVAKKSEFVQLAVADFLAHSSATRNEWFTKLRNGGGVAVEHLSVAKLQRISIQVSELARLYRREKDKNRAQARLQRKTNP